MKKFIASEKELRDLYGKHSPLPKDEVEQEYQEVLICDCPAQTPLVDDPEPLVNVTTEAYAYKCVTCSQRYLFVLSSRELIKGQ